MGTYSDDIYGRGGEQLSEQPEQPQRQRPVTGSRGKVTSRPSRESILQSYAAQDAARARNARMYSQAVSQVYQESSTRANDRAAQRAALVASQREQQAAFAAQRAEAQRARQEAMAKAQREQAARAAGTSQASRSGRPRTRVVPPLSSQESYDRTRSSQESYERARASRDALSETRRVHTPNREVIDGRGSIDSRAFNETHELVGYSIDDRDKPRAAVDASFSETRWHSRAGQGFSDVPDGGARPPIAPRAPRGGNVGFSGGVVSGRANYTAPSGVRGFLAGLPLAVKIAVPVLVLIVILVIVFMPK